MAAGGDTRRLRVSTNHGDAMRARFVCLANGFFQRPKLPGIPGIETFRGHAFHTSRWDYAYTGGDSEGGLDGLRGRRVGSYQEEDLVNDGWTEIVRKLLFVMQSEQNADLSPEGLELRQERFG